jgi:hypothetical protein
MRIFAKNQLKITSNWLYSIGSGYPLIGCSPAVPISVFPDKLNIVKLLVDTVHFTLPFFLNLENPTLTQHQQMDLINYLEVMYMTIL